MKENPCEHDYVFLRQERKNVGYDRDPVWMVEDVFHCRRCLEYKRIAVERRSNRCGSTEDFVQRLV